MSNFARRGAKRRPSAHSRFRTMALASAVAAITLLGVPDASAQNPGGSIVAWGWNNYGQCNVPAPNSSVIAVSGGSVHSLGLMAAGSIVAWESNAYGECNVPIPNSGFIGVAAGSGHSLGLKADGSIVAWGKNDHGQCNVPLPNTSFVAIAASTDHSLGLKADGSIVGWGYNSHGQCNVPPPNSGFVAVAAGWYYSLGLKANGSIVTWGDDSYGQCNVPPPNSGFVDAAAGWSHSLGLKADGSIVAWGYNYYGQCNVPAPNTGFVAIAASVLNTLSVKADGSVMAWGYNGDGQCDVPLPNSGFTAVAGGGRHSLALKQEGNCSPPEGKWTVITHGWSHDDYQNMTWLSHLAMVRIRQLDPTVVVHSMDRHTFEISPGPPFDNTRHHVLTFDWSETCDEWIGITQPLFGDGYAYAAGDALYALMKDAGIAEHVHALIGYSRGAVVMSEATRRLILNGTPPEQVVYLDGEGGAPVYSDSRFDAWKSPTGTPIRYDNIFQSCGCTCPFTWLGGNSKERCWNYDLETAYQHADICDSYPPAIVDYLRTGLLHDGTRYIFPDSPTSDPPTDGLNPNNWDGHAADAMLFNGNFEWNSEAGWFSHGANEPSPGQVVHAYAVAPLNEPSAYLRLFDGGRSMEHSWFWMPSVWQLSFKYKIADADDINCDDVAFVRITNHAGQTQDWEITPGGMCDSTGWLNFTRQVPQQFQNSLCKIKFWIDPGADDVDSELRIDNVSFDPYSPKGGARPGSIP